MYEISDELYLKVAERLLFEIGHDNYFSGSVSLTEGDMVCKLTCTVMVGYGESEYDGSGFRPITRLTPIWWEFHTIEGCEEILNDFSFNEMLELTFDR